MPRGGALISQQAGKGQAGRSAKESSSLHPLAQAPWQLLLLHRLWVPASSPLAPGPRGRVGAGKRKLGRPPRLPRTAQGPPRGAAPALPAGWQLTGN